MQSTHVEYTFTGTVQYSTRTVYRYSTVRDKDREKSNCVGVDLSHYRDPLAKNRKSTKVLDFCPSLLPFSIFFYDNTTTSVLPHCKALAFTAQDSSQLYYCTIICYCRNMTENLDALNLDDHYICFPAGGAFNKLRATSRNSLYLDQLLDDCQPGYMASRKKRAYVQEHILNHIPGGLKIWKGKSPWKGYLVTMDDHEAYEKIAQVMRDRRKTRRFSRVSSSPTTTTTTPPPPSTRPDLVLRPHRRSPRKPGKNNGGNPHVGE